MRDDLKSYVQIAAGLTEVTAAKAREVAEGALEQLSRWSTRSPDIAQVREVAADLVQSSKDNREMLVNVVQAEIDKAVGRMGFVREDELAAVRRHVQRLEEELRALRERIEHVPGAHVPAAPEPGSHPASEAEAGIEPESGVESGADMPKKRKFTVQESS